MMNKKRLPHIIAAVSLVVFIVLGLASLASAPSQWKDVKYNGEDSRLLGGTKWIRTDVDDKKIVEFHPDGKLVARDWQNASWERVGTDVKLVYWDGRFYVEGKYDPDNLTILGVRYDSNGSQYNGFTLRLVGSLSAQRYVDGFDTALYGEWLTFGADVGFMTYQGVEYYDVVVGYTFFAGNFLTYKRYGYKGSIEKLEKGTYTTDDKGTLTFKVTHTYDRTEKIFLSKDEFTARYRSQGKTAAQINEAINEYYPDRSVKYSVSPTPPGLVLFGGEKYLEIYDSIPLRGIGQFIK
jgi:hypothetical protein